MREWQEIQEVLRRLTASQIGSISHGNELIINASCPERRSILTRPSCGISNAARRRKRCTRSSTGRTGGSRRIDERGQRWLNHNPCHGFWGHSPSEDAVDFPRGDARSERLRSNSMAANWPGLTCRPRLESTLAWVCSSFQTCFRSGTSRRIVGAVSAGRPPRLTRRPFNSSSNAITPKGPWGVDAIGKLLDAPRASFKSSDRRAAATRRRGRRAFFLATLCFI